MIVDSVTVSGARTVKLRLARLAVMSPNAAVRSSTTVELAIGMVTEMTPVSLLALKARARRAPPAHGNGPRVGSAVKSTPQTISNSVTYSLQLRTLTIVSRRVSGFAYAKKRSLISSIWAKAAAASLTKARTVATASGSAKD